MNRRMVMDSGKSGSHAPHIYIYEYYIETIIDIAGAGRGHSGDMLTPDYGVPVVRE